MTLVAHHLCPECGARYASDADSCALRFDALLALDHSRREPWGSRHGQAFAAYALQHPLRQCASLDLAWTALYRIYCLNEPAARVFATIRRRRASGATMAAGVPSRPAQPVAAPALTIADLSDFAAPTYATLLDAWCRATLAAWGATITVPTT